MKTIILLLYSVACLAQVETYSFDYWIETTGSDSFYNQPATFTIDTGKVVIKTPYEYFTRYIVAEGVSRSGERVLSFANCDKIRFTTAAGAVDGLFLTNGSLTRYFGISEKVRDERGWTNESKFKK